MTESRAIRIGLAGFGIHGSRYAAHLLAGDVPGARLSAICRKDAAAGRELARAHGLAFHEDPLELASSKEVDAVVAVLPPTLHRDVAHACLSAGRPVLVEKPMAADARAAREVVEKQRATGSLLMVAHTLRFDPLVRAIRREAERLGAIRMVSICQRFEPTGHETRAWLDEPGPGGVILNTGVHGFDLLRYLTGAEPVSIQAEVSRVVTRGTEDQFAAALRLEPGGILCTIDNSRATGGRSGRIEVACERGQVWGDHVHRTLRRIEGRTEVEVGRFPPTPTIPETLRAFVRSIREGCEPEVTGADGLAAMRMVDAAILSARLGRRVDLAT